MRIFPGFKDRGRVNYNLSIPASIRAAPINQTYPRIDQTAYPGVAKLVKLDFCTGWPDIVSTMDQKKTPDFSETERWVVRTTRNERYGPSPARKRAGAKIMRSGAVETCGGQTMFWSAKAAHFTILRAGAKRDRTYLYRHPEQDLGTEVDSYDKIATCVICEPWRPQNPNGRTNAGAGRIGRPGQTG